MLKQINVDRIINENFDDDTGAQALYMNNQPRFHADIANTTEQRRRVLAAKGSKQMKIDYDRYEEIITKDIQRHQNQLWKQNRQQEVIKNVADGFKNHDIERDMQMNEDSNLNQELDIPIAKPTLM